MNNKQKILTVIAIILLIGTLVFAPMKAQLRGSTYFAIAPIWTDRFLNGLTGEAHPRYHILIIEWSIILISYVGLFFVLSNKPSDPKNK